MATTSAPIATRNSKARKGKPRPRSGREPLELLAAHDIGQVAAFLQAHLGQRITAYLSGIKDAKMVGRWVAGRSRPRELSGFRLRSAYPVVRLLSEAFDDETTRAWFFGTNPQLGDRAPAHVLRHGENPDDFGAILPAAREFIGGAQG